MFLIKRWLDRSSAPLPAAAPKATPPARFPHALMSDSPGRRTNDGAPAGRKAPPSIAAIDVSTTTPWFTWTGSASAAWAAHLPEGYDPSVATTATTGTPSSSAAAATDHARSAPPPLSARAAGKRPVGQAPSVAPIASRTRPEPRRLPGIPSLRSLLVTQTTAERLETARIAYASDTSTSELEASIARLPRIDGQAELRRYINAFMDVHIAAAKAKGQPLVVLLPEDHTDSSQAAIKVMMMFKAFDEFGSNMVFMEECHPDQLENAFIGNFSESMLANKNDSDCARFDAELLDSMTSPDPNTREDTGRLTAAYCTHQLGWFRKGFDPHNTPDERYLLGGKRELAMSDRMGREAETGEHPALIGWMGRIHAGFMMDELQSKALHIACFSAYSNGASTLFDQASREQLGRESYLLNHPQVTAVNLNPLFHRQAFEYLKLAKESNFNFRLNHPHDAGLAHGEHVAHLAERLASRHASPAEYRQALGTQKEVLVRHIDALIDGYADADDVAYGLSLLKDATRLARLILPMFGGGTTEEDRQALIAEGTMLYDSLEGCCDGRLPDDKAALDAAFRSMLQAN